MIRALFGGSFDPIHAGHVALIRMLVHRGLADRVHVVPASRSPHKTGRPGGATPPQRLALVRLACAGLPEAVVEDCEVVRGGTSYTVATLTDLVAAHADARWRLVIGADAAAAFPRWREPGRLLDLAEVVVVARGAVELPPLLQERAVVVTDFRHPASGTGIRADLAAGRLPGPDRLPPAVATAIVRDGLYGWPGGGAAAAPPPPEETP